MNDSIITDRQNDRMGTNAVLDTDNLRSQLSDDEQHNQEQLEWMEALQERRLDLAKDPRNVQLLNDVGQTAEAAGDIDRAIWAYKRAIRLDPHYAASYRNLGLLYEELGQKEKAKEAFQNYLNYSGQDVDIQRMLGSLSDELVDEPEESAETADESRISKRQARKWGELDLTPGEAIYLLDPDNAEGREMMRFTILDMIARGILETDGRSGVGRGENYSSTELRPHEMLYARIFSRYEDYIDIDRLAQTITHQLNNRFDSYKNDYVRRSLTDKGYVQKETQRVGGVIPVQRYVLSDEGQRVSNKLRRLMKQTGVYIDRALKTNPEQAKALVAEGGPAILLMESHPSGYFQEWIETLDKIGLGPVVERARSRLQSSANGGIIEEIVKAIFS